MDEVQNVSLPGSNCGFFANEVSNKMPKDTITNEETGESKEYKLGYGANLRKSALFQDVDLYKGLNTQLNCRGMGLCGKCVIEPTPLKNVSEQTLFEKIHRLEPHQRLGCRTKVFGPVTIKAGIQD